MNLKTIGEISGENHERTSKGSPGEISLETLEEFPKKKPPEEFLKP